MAYGSKRAQNIANTQGLNILNMVTLSINTDFANVQNNLNKLSMNLQMRVIPKALNKIVAKAKTSMVRQITSEFNLRSDEVRSRLRVFNAKKQIKDWFVVLDPFGSRRRKGTTINLIRFVERKVTLAEGRRRAKAGTQNKVYFKIRKSGGLSTLHGAFIATNKRTGGTAVFTRVGKDRYPIEAKQTIDVPQMFNTRRIQSVVLKRINDELSIEFDRAINAAAAGYI